MPTWGSVSVGGIVSQSQLAVTESFPLEGIWLSTHSPREEEVLSGVLKTTQRGIVKRRRSHHHYHVVPLARIYLTLSCHFSLSPIASGRSSGIFSVSLHSCWMYVRAGRHAFSRSYVGVHRSTSLMSSSLLLQQCPVRQTWIVFVIRGRWPYSWCLVGCCRQVLFKIARTILV